ncbi:mPR-like GPCR protein [Xylariaceae sp. AK1471]|nr:mPR-like GPCR protein [Xylariaceae sp. AK1471]
MFQGPFSRLSSELKKRQVSTDISTTNNTASPSSATAQTVTCQEISKWQFDNKYILSGYGPEKRDCREILMSLTFLHNETCNVYTHLIGALLLPLFATSYLWFLAEPQYLNVKSIDYAIFGIFFWCAGICLDLSVLYHLMLSHSHRIEQFWHGMDLLGIIIVIVGTFTSGIYYLFFCEPSLRKMHWAMNWTMGTITGILTSNPSLRTSRGRKVKVGAFMIFGATSFIHLLHGAQRYGFEHMLQYAGMDWYFLEIFFYGTSAILYAFRIPERLAPGNFDIWGSSHQIFHVSILCWMWAHASGLAESFTSFHTMDVCGAQGIGQGS